MKKELMEEAKVVATVDYEAIEKKKAADKLGFSVKELESSVLLLNQSISGIFNQAAKKAKVDPITFFRVMKRYVDVY